MNILVGASCVNAVSEYTNLYICTGGKKYGIEFAKGHIVKGLHVIEDGVQETGTTVSFKLDKEIWLDEQYDPQHIKARLKQLAYLNAGLTVNYTYDKSGNGTNVVEETFCYPEGLLGYINNITENKTQLIAPEYCRDTKSFNKPDGEAVNVNIEFAFTYTDSHDQSIKTFVNNVATEYGGDHLTGMRAGIFSAIKKYANENGFEKQIKTLESEDCGEGLQCLLSVKLKDPNFEGQGKGKLRMTAVRSLTREVVETFLFNYLSKDINRAKIVLDKVLDAARVREAAKRARNAAREIKNISSGGVVENFADCASKKPEECEIYLVEGK